MLPDVQYDQPKGSFDRELLSCSQIALPVTLHPSSDRTFWPLHGHIIPYPSVSGVSLLNLVRYL